MAQPNESEQPTAAGSQRLELPPASLPYRRGLHSGNEISIYYDLQRPIVWPEHQHEQVQITLLFEPATCLFAWRVPEGGMEQRLTGPQICVVAANQPHACRWEREADLLVIYIELSLLRRIGIQDISGVLITQSGSHASHDVVIRELASTLRLLCREQNKLDALSVDGIGGVLATRLLKLLVTAGAESTASGARLSPNRLRLVTDYINAHLSYDIHVADLAKQVGQSAPHFAEVFKNATGQAPYEYITQCRMLRAHEMLLTGEYRLHEVGEAVGYEDQGHFSTKFRNFFGYSPKVLLARVELKTGKSPKKA
jgi:AraC family transcriptional regulator